LIKTISEKGLHFDIVLFVIKTNVAKIRRMEDNITLILHHGSGLEQDGYQRQYVHGEFCVWKKADASRIKLIFDQIIQGLI